MSATTSKTRLLPLMRVVLDAIILQYQLPIEHRVKWLYIYLAGLGLISLIGMHYVEKTKSILVLQSIFSLFVVGLWWFQFVAFMRAQSGRSHLQLVPVYRRAMMLLLVGMWFATGLLASAFFLLPDWFFVCVLALVFAASLTNKRERDVALVLVIVLTITCISLAATFDYLWFSSRGRANNIFAEITITGWATFAGFFALLGLTRIAPLIGLFIWAGWISAALFSQPLLGISFGELLIVIYEMTSQITTHIITAFVLFGLLFYALFGSTIRGTQSIQGASPNSRMGIFFKAALFKPITLNKWRPNLGWQTLPGVDYLLDRVTKAPFDFQSLLPFMFARIVHWTTICWIGLATMLLVVIYTSPLNAAHPNAALAFISILFTPFAAMLPSALIRATYASRAEQDLLSLTPSWPPRRELNRQLAHHFVKLCGIVVVVGLLMIISIATALQVEIHALWRPLFMIVAMGLVLLAAVLRPYAEMKSINLGIEAAFWSVLIMTPSVMLVLSYSPNYQIGLLPEVTLFVILTLAIWRYRQFLRAPRVLPAGNKR